MQLDEGAQATELGPSVPSKSGRNWQVEDGGDGHPAVSVSR